MSPSDFARTPGMAFDPDWFEAHAVNTPAAERRAAQLPARRSLKKDYQAAWLVNAIRCMDLTTLAGDDTEARVRRQELAADTERVRQILGDGAAQAREKASQVLQRVQQACGLR